VTTRKETARQLCLTQSDGVALGIGNPDAKATRDREQRYEPTRTQVSMHQASIDAHARYLRSSTS
jgi:hypothetical protein